MYINEDHDINEDNDNNEYDQVMCKRQEMLLLEKRRILLKLLDLFEVRLKLAPC